MPTLQDLKDRSKQEFFDQLEQTEDFSREGMDNMIHRIATRQVPIIYYSILQLATENLEFATGIPQSTKNSQYSPIILIKSNIYEHLSQHLHKSFYDFNSNQKISPKGI